MHKESGHRWKSRGLALPSLLLQLTLHDIRSRERRRPVSLFPSYLGDFLTAPALHCCPWLPANGRAGHTAADGPRCPSAISPWSQTAVKLRHARLICPFISSSGRDSTAKRFPSGRRRCAGRSSCALPHRDTDHSRRRDPRAEGSQTVLTLNSRQIPVDQLTVARSAEAFAHMLFPAISSILLLATCPCRLL